MAKLHVGNLVDIRWWIVNDKDEDDNGEWLTKHRWQNVNPSTTVVRNGKNYSFLPFIYNGATRTRTGDNIEASLAVSTNQISMDYAYDIVVIFQPKAASHQTAGRVQTCLFNDDFTSVSKILTREEWIGASMGYSNDVVEIQLASAIDAGFQDCNQYLDEATVGRLPTTSRVTTT